MQRRPYLGRRPRRNSRANVKTRIGIAATALVLGGGATAVVVASHGPASSAAQSASYDSYMGHRQSAMTEWNLLNSAVGRWGSSTETSMTSMASVSQEAFGQTTEHHKTLDMQRGVVVFASRHFLIVQSKNGSMHLWLLSGNTKFENVANSTTGTTAMTGSSTASEQAVNDGNMDPLIEILTGGNQTAADSMLAPASQPQTVTVPVPGTNLTVTVTITQNTAQVNQTGTTPASGTSVMDPTTTTESAWTTAGTRTNLARGDVAMIVGTRSHGLLHAEIVLYTPLSGSGTTATSSPTPTPSISATPSPTRSATPSPSPSIWPTSTVSPSTSPTSDAGFPW
jgi:hypothetical protein